MDYRTIIVAVAISGTFIIAVLLICLWRKNYELRRSRKWIIYENLMGAEVDEIRNMPNDLGVFISELNDIGFREGFIFGGKKGAPIDAFYAFTYPNRSDHIRARALGERLNELGGKQLMSHVHDVVVESNIGVVGDWKHLRVVWQGVGNWDYKTARER